jgi:hypothetical protein
MEYLILFTYICAYMSVYVRISIMSLRLSRITLTQDKCSSSVISAPDPPAGLNADGSIDPRQYHIDVDKDENATIEEWLRALGLEKYESIFKENKFKLISDVHEITEKVGVPHFDLD